MKSTKSCRDISEKIINTRVMLREIDIKLKDLQKWKEERKKDFDEKIKLNKQMVEDQYSEKEVQRLKEKEKEEDEGYEKYVKKLQDMMNFYTNSK